MYPLHDNDLDRLSRNAAEHYEMDFGSSGSGWEQLEKRLDQELPPPRNRRRFLFWLFFIVVTTGSALIGLLISSKPTSPYADNHLRAVVPSNRLQAALPVSGEKYADRKRAKAANELVYDSENTNTIRSREDGRKTVDWTEPEEVPAGSDIFKAGKKSALNPAAVGSAQSGSSTQVNRKAAINSSIRPTTLSRKPSHNSKRSNKLIEAPAPFAELAQSTNQSKKTNSSITGNNPTTEDRSFNQINHPGTTLNTPDGIANSTVSTDSSRNQKPDSSVVEKSDKPKIPHTYKQKWEFAITAGPDASMVEFGPLFKAGYNFGIQIGYRFNDRWSANTGLIYTRKYYQADSNTFHAPAHSPISYGKIDDLKGFCAMFDIPLNVRYDVSLNDKRRLFVSAGASTYLMKRQYYDCSFRSWSNPTPNRKEWDSKESPEYFKKNHLLSVLNLSAGYERKVSRHFSVQAEPYLKVPLSGMGYGTMKIGSYGMFFSLKYHPVSRSVQKN